MSTKSIWDTRFTPPKVALDADVEAAFLALDDLDIAEDEWKTIKGAKVLLDDDTGEILGGMGGKFHGRTLKDALDKRKQKRAQRITARERRFNFGSEEGAKEDRKREAAKIKERMNRDWKADPPACVDHEFLQENLGARDINIVANAFEKGGLLPEVLKETKGAMLLKFDGTPVGDPDRIVEMWVPKGKILNQKETWGHGYPDHPHRTGNLYGMKPVLGPGKRGTQKRDINVGGQRQAHAEFQKWIDEAVARGHF